jgi:hypothetical protein
MVDIWPALQKALCAFSYPEPFLRAVNRARRGALAKSISKHHTYVMSAGASLDLFEWGGGGGKLILPSYQGKFCRVITITN